jgi:predicted DNA-binding protein (MmcQ/YjbR family)
MAASAKADIERGLDRRRAVVKAMAEAKPGSVGTDMRTVLIYKVMGKVFAILSMRGAAFVILKCDPHLAETLRGQYAGVGHRSHLDHRFWISVSLGADVPARVVRQLVDQSYDLVCAGLTKKQQGELEGVSPRKARAR